VEEIKAKERGFGRAFLRHTEKLVEKEKIDATQE
jgi:hypothetical protein